MLVVLNQARQRAPKPWLTYASRTVVDIRRLASQAWYRHVTSKAKFGRGDLSAQSYLVDTVKRYVNAAKDRDGYALGRQEQELRTSLTKMPFHTFLSPILIKKSRIMEEPGLPAIPKRRRGRLPIRPQSRCIGALESPDGRRH